MNKLALILLTIGFLNNITIASAAFRPGPLYKIGYGMHLYDASDSKDLMPFVLEMNERLNLTPQFLYLAGQNADRTTYSTLIFTIKEDDIKVEARSSDGTKIIQSLEPTDTNLMTVSNLYRDIKGKARIFTYHLGYDYFSGSDIPVAKKLPFFDTFRLDCKTIKFKNDGAGSQICLTTVHNLNLKELELSMLNGGEPLEELPWPIEAYQVRRTRIRNIIEATINY